MAVQKRKKILFAHSAGAQYGPGKGSCDLVKYLKSKLSDNFSILYPKIKKPNSPTYEKYKTLYSKALKDITEPIIVIGHSLGASTILKYLTEEKPDISVSGLFLVATPRWKSNMKEFQLKENFQASLKNIPAIFLYNSKKDTVVPIEHLEYYEKVIKNATVRKLPGNEHLFSKGIPALVSDIQKLKRKT